MKEYLLLVVLPNLSGFFQLAAIIMIIIAIFNCLAADPAKESEKNNAILGIKYLFIPGLILLFVGNFIPSKKEFLQLQTIKIFKETKGIEQVPQKLVDKINSLLEITDKQ